MHKHYGRCSIALANQMRSRTSCQGIVEPHAAELRALRQGDPLSTLLFATTMSTVVCQEITAVDVQVTGVSYTDDTVLVGSPEEVASVLQELPTILAPTGLQLQPAKMIRKVWGPTPGVVDSHPQLSVLKATMSDVRGLTILGEAVGLEPEDAYPVGEEATCPACVETIKPVCK